MAQLFPLQPKVRNMAISRDKKESIVEKISTILKDNETSVFVSFDKLTVVDDVLLRTSIDKDNGYFVAKKTLIKKAFENTNIEGELPQLDGKIAISYGKDKIEPARVINKLSKKLSGEIKIVGGIFENKVANSEFMQEISIIPSTNELYGKFVNIINFPIQGFVSTLNQIAKKINN